MTYSYEIITSTNALKLIEHELSDKKIVAFDYETVDRSYPNVEPVGASYAWIDHNSTIRGCYIPVGHKEGKNIPLDVYIKFAESVLNDSGKEICAHNFKYDHKVNLLLKPQILIDPDRAFDTQVVYWLLDTVGAGTKAQRLVNKGLHGLKPIVKYEYGHEMKELKDIVPKEGDVLRVDLGDIEEVGPYAAEDAIWTLKLALDLKEKLVREKDLRRVYDEVEKEFIFCLSDMEYDGAELDQAILEDMSSKMLEEVKELKRKLFLERPEIDFDPMDTDTVLGMVEAYEDLEHQDDLSPYHKGQARKEIFEDLEEDHPLELKIRDDSIRKDLFEYPELAHKVFNPESTLQLQHVLFEECRIEPIGEKSEKSGWYCTDKACMKEWSEQGHKIPEILLRFKKLAKLHSTFVLGMLERVGEDGRIRTRFHRPISTGRLSSRDPNLQNIVKSDEFPIRRAFVGTGVSKSIQSHNKNGGLENISGRGGGYSIEDGRVKEWWGDNPPWVMGVADYSQLEIRILAHFSKDPTLTQAILDGTDIHGLTATLVFDELPEDISPDEVKTQFPKIRDDAKPINFGIIYGMGPNKLSRTLGIPKWKAKETISNYYAGYEGIGKWIQEQHDMVKNYGYVKTLLGRKRHLPAGQLPITEDNLLMVWHAQRQAQNSPIQGTAADIINTSMVEIRRYFSTNTALDVAQFLPPREAVNHSMRFDVPIWRNWYRMLIQVHDEIVCEFHPAIANWGLDKMINIMETSLTLDVPLIVDAALGTNWYETKE